jgi:hypothetical protein
MESWSCAWRRDKHFVSAGNLLLSVPVGVLVVGDDHKWDGNRVEHLNAEGTNLRIVKANHSTSGASYLDSHIRMLGQILLERALTLARSRSPKSVRKW